MSREPVWRTERDVRTEQATVTARTSDVVYDDCALPAAGTADEAWRCPDCGSTWRWLPAVLLPARAERYGFLRLRTRVVTPPPPPDTAGMWLPAVRTCRLVVGR